MVMVSAHVGPRPVYDSDVVYNYNFFAFFLVRQLINDDRLS